MKYKRSFINSDYRPFVNGSTFDNRSLVTRITDRIQDPLARNKMIMDIMNGTSEIEGLEYEWAQNILIEVFPKLAFLRKRGNSNAGK